MEAQVAAPDLAPGFSLDANKACQGQPCVQDCAHGTRQLSCCTSKLWALRAFFPWIMKLKGHIGNLACRGADVGSLEGDEPLDAAGDNELFRFEVFTNAIPQPAFEPGCQLFSAFPPTRLQGRGKKEETRTPPSPGCPGNAPFLWVL